MPFDLTEIDLNVTDRCNLTCQYCSVFVEPVNSNSSELTLRQIAKLYNEFEATSVRLVRIAGGEPFVRKDICEIIELAGQRSFRIEVLTNGTAIREHHLKRIASLPVNCGIAFSIDGANCADHNESRGCNSAFDRVVAIMDHCARLGISHSIMTAVTKHSVERLAEIVDFAADHGAKNVNFIMLGSTGEAADNPNIFPSYENWCRSILDLSEYLYKQSDLPNVTVLFPHEDPVPFELYDPLQKAGLLHLLEDVWKIPWRLHSGVVGRAQPICTAGKDSLTILPNGDVYGCDLMRNHKKYLAGNVLTQSIQEIFENSVVLTNLRAAQNVFSSAGFSDDSRTFSCGQCRVGAEHVRTSDKWMFAN